MSFPLPEFPPRQTLPQSNSGAWERQMAREGEILMLGRAAIEAGYPPPPPPPPLQVTPQSRATPPPDARCGYCWRLLTADERLSRLIHLCRFERQHKRLGRWTPWGAAAELANIGADAIAAAIHELRR